MSRCGPPTRRRCAGSAGSCLTAPSPVSMLAAGRDGIAAAARAVARRLYGWSAATSRRPCWRSSRPASSGHARGVVPLVSAAEELPLRTASLDLVTAFNCVHHFDLGRFLTAVSRVLQPDGQLFIDTRTPQQNARTIWGRYFPGFTEHEQRLHSQAAFRDAIRRTDGLRVVAAEDLQASALEHSRAAQGSGRRSPLLDVSLYSLQRSARIHSGVPGPPAQP